MQRRELIQLGACIVSGLGIAGLFDGISTAVEVAADKSNSLDESHLPKGLAGMARADGWFNAHWGAAIISGYYLSKENNLGEETVSSIRRQLDAMIDVKAAQYMPFPENEANEKLIEDKEKVRLCSRILLERYFNPEV